MAYSLTTDARYFQPIGGQSGHGQGAAKGAPAMWSYKTADAHATVDTAGYFNALSTILKAGDLIYVVVVTNRGASNEAVSTAGFHLVNSVSSGVVDVANVTAITTTDSD